MIVALRNNVNFEFEQELYATVTYDVICTCKNNHSIMRIAMLLQHYTWTQRDFSAFIRSSTTRSYMVSYTLKYHPLECTLTSSNT